jgi:hypothetical protein
MDLNDRIIVLTLLKDVGVLAVGLEFAQSGERVAFGGNELSRVLLRTRNVSLS